jgi:integrase-like protein
MPRDPPRLLDPVRERIRFKHYSIRTEQAYVDWIKRYMRFHGNRHPSALGAPDVERFLTHLAVDGGVAQSTQNQAHSALLFLYREVLLQDMPWQQLPRDKAAARLPVVLTPRGRMPARCACRQTPPVRRAPLRHRHANPGGGSHPDLVHALHRTDLEDGHGAVWLPPALRRKYPAAAREWIWQYAFPADRLSLDPRDGAKRRHRPSQ